MNRNKSPSGVKNRQKTPEKLEEHVPKPVLLRNEVMKLINKFASPDTRENAVVQMVSLISLDPTPSNLRIFLSCLNQEKRDVSTREVEYVVLTYGLLAQGYKKDLKDSFDNPPDLNKTIKRITGIIQKRFLKDSHDSVQQACARVFIDINENCLGGCSAMERMNLIYDPLMTTIVSGEDVIAQKNASAIIYELCLYLISKESAEEEVKNIMLPDLVQCYIKYHVYYGEILGSIGAIASVYGLGIVENKLQELLNRLKINLEAKTTDQIGEYLFRIEACNLLKILGSKYCEVVDEKTRDEIYKKLYSLSKNKILKVQIAASEAAKTWDKNYRDLSNENKKKRPKTPSPGSKFKDLRTKYKENKVQREAQEPPEPKKNLIVKDGMYFLRESLIKATSGAGWAPNTRGHKFVKRGTGSGGGNINQEYLWMNERPKSSKPDYKSVKEVAKVLSKQKIDYDKKFQILEEKHDKNERDDYNKKNDIPTDNEDIQAGGFDFEVDDNVKGDQNINAKQNSNQKKFVRINNQELGAVPDEKVEIKPSLDDTHDSIKIKQEQSIINQASAKFLTATKYTDLEEKFDILSLEIFKSIKIGDEYSVHKKNFKKAKISSQFVNREKKKKKPRLHFLKQCQIMRKNLEKKQAKEMRMMKIHMKQMNTINLLKFQILHRKIAIQRTILKILKLTN